MESMGDLVTNADKLMEKLNKACENRDVREVESMMSYVTRPNFPRKELEAKYRPPLYYACKGGSLEIVKILIERYPGCDPYFITDVGHSLLYIACARGHIKVTQYLSEVCSISPTESCSLGTTPIFAATYNGHYKMLEFMISALKCDPKSLNLKGESLLHIACDRNHLKIAQYLVKEHNLDPRQENDYKKTPLHSACSSGNLSIAKYLIEELNCKTEVFDRAGSTPLHDACRNGYVDVVRYFIRLGCDLHLYDCSGCMPLHVACRFGRRDVVKVLLNEGKVNPNGRTLTDRTPLQLARDEDPLKELIRGGANTSGPMTIDIFRDFKIQQPLHFIVHIFMIGHSSSGKSTLVKALQQSKHFFPSNVQVKPHTAGVIPINFDSPEFGKVLLYDFAGDYEFHPSHAALLEHSRFTSPPLFILVVNLLDRLEASKRIINYWVQFVENHSIPNASSPHMIVVGSHFDALHKSHEKVSSIENYVQTRLKSSTLTFNGFFPIDCRAPNRQATLRTNLKRSCNHLRSLPKEVFDPACHALAVILARHFCNRFACTVENVIEISSVSDYPIPIQAERLCDLSEALSARTKILFLRNHADPKRSWIVLDIHALLHSVNGKIFAPKGKGFTESVFEPTSTGILPWSQLSREFPDLDPFLIVGFLGRLEFCQVISDSEVLDLIKGKVSLISQSPSDDSDPDSDVERDYSPTSNPSRLPAKSSRKAESRRGSFGDPKFPVTSEFSPYGTQMMSAAALPQPPPYRRCISNHESGHKPVSQYFPPSKSSTYPTSLARTPRIYPSLDLKEKYLFFPGLISPEQPRQDMWNRGDFEYYSGWCLKCVNDQQFFSLRFLHTLLLRLSFSFALTKSSRGLCEQVECTLWKNGLRWLNLDGIETIVEVVEDRKAVLLLTRMKEGSAGRGLNLRSAVIQKILDTKKEYCMQIVTSESFIDPSHLKARHGYPVINRLVDELKRYDISLIAEAFHSNKRYVYDVKGHDFMEVEKLIKFDPYMCLGANLLRNLYNKDKQDLSLADDILWEFAACYPDKAEIFQDMLGVRPFAKHDCHNPCFGVLHSFNQSGAWTLADFRKKLDMYSIFCGRNILECCIK